MAKLSFGLLIWFALSGTPALAQYGLVDGGFDSQGASVSSYCYFQLGNCPTGSWQGRGGLVHSGNVDWGGVVANTPQSYGVVQQASLLSQTFVATASGQFRFSWFDADRPGAGGHTYMVKLNGVALGTYSPTVASFRRQLSAVFTLVAGTSYTLLFEGQATTADRSAFTIAFRSSPAKVQCPITTMRSDDPCPRPLRVELTTVLSPATRSIRLGTVPEYRSLGAAIEDLRVGCGT